jgi:hypothetical protein
VRTARWPGRRQMRRSGAITKARGLDVLPPMICARVLVRSAYSQVREIGRSVSVAEPCRRGLVQRETRLRARTRAVDLRGASGVAEAAEVAGEDVPLRRPRAGPAWSQEIAGGSTDRRAGAAEPRSGRIVERPVSSAAPTAADHHDPRT